jgi:hypothetical protein
MWTSKMEAALVDVQPGRTAEQIAAHLNMQFGTTMTRWSVSAKMRELKIVRQHRWTPGERAAVRTELSKAILALRGRLGRRSTCAIAHEIVNLIIRRARKRRFERVA